MSRYEETTFSKLKTVRKPGYVTRQSTLEMHKEQHDKYGGEIKVSETKKSGGTSSPI